MDKKDNYQIQAQQAKQLFLTYDQQKLIHRCSLAHDEAFFYITFLSRPYRISRKTGDMEYLSQGAWVQDAAFATVMTVLDWLCDSRPDRFITGRWVNIVTQGHYFHRSLQESRDPDAEFYDQYPEKLHAACRALQGQPLPGADIGYAIELMDGLRIFVRFWHSDEEFPAKLMCLWEENVLQYIRYETTWFAQGLVLKRLWEYAHHCIDS